ncbi:MAG: hypothetical protein NTW49_08170 [Bacteroidia bacterium]|nr:hypothetical protein [Bacteroidia bacterium]
MNIAVKNSSQKEILPGTAVPHAGHFHGRKTTQRQMKTQISSHSCVDWYRITWLKKNQRNQRKKQS